jgi:hypothetical protein
VINARPSWIGKKGRKRRRRGRAFGKRKESKKMPIDSFSYGRENGIRWIRNRKKKEEKETYFSF